MSDDGQRRPKRLRWNPRTERMLEPTVDADGRIVFTVVPREDVDQREPACDTRG